jgi:hypothetical protein
MDSLLTYYEFGQLPHFRTVAGQLPHFRAIAGHCGIFGQLPGNCRAIATFLAKSIN